MAHHKRKASKRRVRCTLCTPHRWMGNHKERRPPKERRAREHLKSFH